MAIRFACSTCKTPYAVNDVQAGKVMDCRQCGNWITVPGSAATHQPTPPPTPDPTPEPQYEPPPYRPARRRRRRQPEGMSATTTGFVASFATLTVMGIGFVLCMILAAVFFFSDAACRAAPKVIIIN